MVMDVAGSYGDWRQPLTPSQQAPPSLTSTREHSPVSTVDVNFNSPGHRSSQDGSFIQDEDMQLILEFGAKATSTPNKTASGGQNVGVLSESWMHRHAKWATDFDANVAELDFDHFSRRDIRTLRKTAVGYQLSKNLQDDAGEMMWDSFTTAAHDTVASSLALTQHAPSADCNHNKIRTVPPCNSLDASLAISAGSLFSSAGGGVGNTDLLTCNEEQAALLINHDPSAMPAFISTDSLDLSSMAGQEELIRAACTTKKRDYVLTFDRGGAVSESGVGGSDDTDYQDARLSNAVERSLTNNCFEITAGITESLSTGNDEDNDRNTFVTWGGVKRSYETDRQLDYNDYSTRFTSLPNLNNFSSRHGRESIECMGGGERMMSRNGDHYMPIYELKQSTTGDVSMSESINGECVGNDTESASRFSLLKAFKSKLSGTFDRLPLPQFRTTADHSSGDSSGYLTGTGSQQGYGVGAKPKSLPKVSVASGDDCEMKACATVSKEPGVSDGLDTTTTDDYNYAEFFINGRYIDINHNEIGFVPPSTRGVQRAPTNQQQQFFVSSKPSEEEQGDFVTSPPPQLTSFHQQAAKAAKYGLGGSNTRPPAKPPRTFATLLRQQQDEDRENANNGGYILQQRPERAPYGRRILPKIPDESQINATEVSRMKDSATQVPVYVVDQSVQTTSIANGGHTLIVVTTCVTKANISDPFYVGSRAQAGAATAASSSTLADWKKMLFGFNGSSVANVPDLNFLKFPFNVPQLFPHVPPFPMAFLNDGPDVTSFVAQQAKLINASDDQLAAPRRVLPSPPPVFTPSKQLSPAAGLQQLLPPQPLFAQTKLADCMASPANGSSSSTPGVRRDSGIGSSAGPSHIQDWESLATLLPKDVLQAYSFFKTNTELLGRSMPTFRPDLNIDKRSLSRATGCNNCANNGRTTGKRASLKLSSHQKSRRLGRKQRPLSEPAFKRKQFESIVEEEDKLYDETSAGISSSRVRCYCHRKDAHNVHQSRHHHHTTTWCCPTQARRPKCQCGNEKKSPCKKRFGGHVCAGDTDDTEDDEVDCANEHKYQPLNHVAKNLGGLCSDDECLMPPVGMRHHHLVCSDDEDEDEEYCVSPSPMRETLSEYHVRETIGSMRSRVPKFYSVQNMKELSQFGPIDGYPLKKLRPTQLACGSDDAAARPCATCYRVRSPSQELTDSGSLVVVVEDHNLTDSDDCDFCDCKTSDIIEELKSKMCRNCDGTKIKKRIGHDARIYQQKKSLVKDVATACDVLMKHLHGCHRSEPWQELSCEKAKAASAIIRYSLCPTVERLVADGLLQGKSVWTVALASATLGPATKSIYELVTDLDKSVGENGEHSLLFVAFVNGLLSLRSLDCWFSYLSLKDKVLSDNYGELAFMRKATTSYKSLFDKLLKAIQPLSILPFDQLNLDPLNAPPLPIQVTVSKADQNIEDEEYVADGALGACTGLSSTVSLHKEIVVTFQRPCDGSNQNTCSMPINVVMERNGDGDGMRYSLIPTRLPSDSRVPKSSSMPSKMVRHASEPPKSRSFDTGISSGVQVDKAAFQAIIDTRRETTSKTTPERKPSFNRPSRIPVWKSSRSCLEGTRQRSLSNRRVMIQNQPVVCVESTGSESVMSVTASTFSEIDAPDTNAYTDSDYRSADARYVYAIDEQMGDRKQNLLAFSKGDTMILLEDNEDGFLRCQRNGEIGLVSRKKVTYVTFL